MRAQTCLNWTLKAAALTTLVVGVAGCGGGGSPSAPITATNALRTLQAGDAWTYSVSGKVTAPDGTASSLRNGSYVRSIQNVPGGPGLSITEASTLVFADGSGGTANILSFITQDSGGNVAQTADNREINGNVESADSGSQTIIPGVWNAGTGISSDTSYTIHHLLPDGTTTVETSNQESFALTVIGQENIVTPVGTFQTWKTSMSQHLVTQGSTINSIGWWSPQLGSFVKLESTETTSSGLQQVTYVLQSTTVAH